MKTIKTPSQHAEALQRLAALAARYDSLREKERDELEVLTVLVEKYERENLLLPPPNPIDAIRFRMHQMGYKQKDLGHLLGGASRASEVLTGKRQLSPAMMRRLHEAWQIPVESLLGISSTEPPQDGGQERSAASYPLKQMYDRGYIPGRAAKWKQHSKDKADLLRRFFAVGTSPLVPAMHRRSSSEKVKVNAHALEAWGHRVLVRAAAENLRTPWDPASVDGDFLRWLAGLSYAEKEGPQLACQALREKGIEVIIEPRLDGTHLDGAAFLTAEGRPVIGLTLRQNRLDNFWFTLFHEIGHVLRHLRPDHPAIFDWHIDSVKTDQAEREADQFALDAFIPPEQWPELRRLHYAKDLRAAASRLRVGVAVIAGRLRREANDYRKHRTLVGQGKARAAFGFSETDWPK